MVHWSSHFSSEEKDIAKEIWELREPELELRLRWTLQCPRTSFEEITSVLIGSFEDWEEIPAWREICILYGDFQAGMLAHGVDLIPLETRRLVLLTTQLLPARLLDRGDVCCSDAQNDIY